MRVAAANCGQDVLEWSQILCSSQENWTEFGQDHFSVVSMQGFENILKIIKVKLSEVLLLG